MPQTTHTPGPWTVTEHTRLVNGKRRTTYAIAPEAAATADGLGTVDANARLIAAAPEMLALLERGVLLADTAGIHAEWSIAVRMLFTRIGG